MKSKEELVEQFEKDMESIIEQALDIGNNILIIREMVECLGLNVSYGDEPEVFQSYLTVLCEYVSISEIDNVKYLAERLWDDYWEN